MKVGDLVKNKRNDKVGIIMGYVKTHRCVGTMYGVFIDGKMYAQHEIDLEVL
jgi:hypothetical protein